jgi:hypothetical protein
MDRATQQNAALVEEMAAAASSLKTQAQELVQTVSVFTLSASHSAHKTQTVGSQNKTPVKISAPPAERRGPDRATNVARIKAPAGSGVSNPPLASTAPIKTGTDGDWTTF